MHASRYLARLKQGRVSVKYRQIECEPADGIVVSVDKYRASLGGWLRLSLKNVAGACASSSSSALLRLHAGRLVSMQCVNSCVDRPVPECASVTHRQVHASPINCALAA